MAGRPRAGRRRRGSLLSFEGPRVEALHLGAPAELENCTNLGNKYPSSPRPISTDRLSALLRVHRRPINLVVYQGSYSLKGMGELISRTASRLDAFSGYPFRA